MKKILLFIAVTCFVTIGLQAQDASRFMHDPNISYFDVKTLFEKVWKVNSSEKGSGYNVFKRYEEFMLSHMDKQGFYDPQRYLAAYKNSGISAKKSKSSSWHFAGVTVPPSPYGYNNNGIGRTEDIAFHPTDTLTYYVAASTGGLWKTTDGGQSYACLSLTWSNNSIVGLAINATNPLELWVATPGYLYHTVNAGVSFTEVNVSSSLSGLTEFTANFQSGVLLAGTSAGLKISSDNGASWTSVSVIAQSVSDIAIHPTNNQIVYVAAKSGLFKSANGGASFAQVTATGATIGTTNNRIALSAANVNAVWLLAASLNRLTGVYKSTDQGATFSTILSSTTQVVRKSNNTSYAADVWFGGQAFIHAAIGVSHTNPSLLFVGGVSVMYSTDGGSSWILANDGYSDEVPHVDHLNIRFQPTTDSPFSCNDGGVSKGLRQVNATGLYLWDNLNNSLAITQMYGISVSNDGTRIITGQQDNGSYIYKKEVDAWSCLAIGDGVENDIQASNNNVFFVAHQDGRLFVTDNGGANFYTLLGSTSFSESSSFRTRFKMHPIDDGVIFNLRKNLWKSEDYGTNWTDLTASLTDDFTSGDFTFARNAPHNMIVYNKKEKVFHSSDAGKTWSSITVPLDQYGSPIWVYQVAMHATDSLKIWIADYTSVYYTSNKGQTWTKYASWPALSVNKMMHVDGSADELLLATSTGLFIKRDASLTLEEFAPGLPKVAVTDVEISYCTSEIYVATFGFGAWKNDITLPALACCKKMPESVSAVSTMLCQEGQLIKLKNATGPYVWSRNDTIISHTADSLLVLQGGYYGVYSNAPGCETGTAYFNLKEVARTATFPFCRDFETTPYTDVLVLKQNTSYPFTLLSGTGCSSSGDTALAFRIEQAGSLYNAGNDTLAFAISEVDLTNTTNAILGFDVSSRYSNFSNGANELDIAISDDCGKTFTIIAGLKESDMAVVSAVTDFVPLSCNDWKHADIDISDYVGKKIMVKFLLHSIVASAQNFWGGNFFIDNICIDATPVITSIRKNDLINASSISIAPNPVYDLLLIHSEEEILLAEVYNMEGKKMAVMHNNKKVDTSTLPAAQYVLNVTTEKETVSFLFIKN